MAVIRLTCLITAHDLGPKTGTHFSGSCAYENARRGGRALTQHYTARFRGSILLLLLGRRSGWRRCSGRRRSRRTDALDLAFGSQLGDERPLLAAHHEVLQLILHLVELRRLAIALVLDLDHVPAELGFHRIGELALIELERDLGEFRHHLVLGEISKIAAVSRA